jgi:hypothetical protein
VKTWVLGLVREHYADFGPTLIAEKLAEKHELVLSRETLRLWLNQPRNQANSSQAKEGARRKDAQNAAGPVGEGAAAGEH